MHRLPATALFMVIASALPALAEDRYGAPMQDPGGYGVVTSTVGPQQQALPLQPVSTSSRTLIPARRLGWANRPAPVPTQVAVTALDRSGYQGRMLYGSATASGRPQVPAAVSRPARQASTAPGPALPARPVQSQMPNPQAPSPQVSAWQPPVRPSVQPQAQTVSRPVASLAPTATGNLAAWQRPGYSAIPNGRSVTAAPVQNPGMAAAPAPSPSPVIRQAALPPATQQVYQAQSAIKPVQAPAIAPTRTARFYSVHREFGTTPDPIVSGPLNTTYIDAELSEDTAAPQQAASPSPR